MDAAAKLEAIQDIHICGACRAQFSNVDIFVQHKQQECPVIQAIRESSLSQAAVSQSTVETHQDQPQTASQARLDLSQAHETPLAVESADEDSYEKQTAELIKDNQTVYGQDHPVARATYQVIQQPQGHDYIQTHPDTQEQQVLPAQLATADGQIVVHLDPGGGYVSLQQQALPPEEGSIGSHPVAQHIPQEYIQTETQSGSTVQTGYQTQLVQEVPSTVHLGGQTLQSQKTELIYQAVEYETGSQSSDILYNEVPQSSASVLYSSSGATIRPEIDNQQHITILKDVQDRSEEQQYLAVDTSPQFESGNQAGIEEGRLLAGSPDTLQQHLPELQYTLAVGNKGSKSQSAALHMTGSADGKITDPALDGSEAYQARTFVQVSSSGALQQAPRRGSSLSREVEKGPKRSQLIYDGENMYIDMPGKDKHQQITLQTAPVTPTRKASKSQSVEGKGIRSPLDKKFKCDVGDCEYRSAYLKDLERHHRIHTGEKPFSCQQCGKAFNRNDKLTLHMRYHAGEKPFQCSLCDYSAVESGSLKKHMRIHTDSRPFKCQVCPYSSRSSSQLMIHLRIHTGDTPYSCTYCKALFKVTSDLKRHMRIHTGEKPYKCEFCEYKCSVKGNLRVHYRNNHSAGSQSQCDVCPFMSSSKRALREHMKTHEVKAELTCNVCHYQCSTKGALRNHMRMHSEEKPFECEFCDYTSKQSGNIMTHMRRKHPEKLWLKSRRGKHLDKKRSASLVEAPAPSRMENKRGTLRIKGKCAKMYNCNLCDASFVREDSWKCHIRHHKDSAQNSLSTAYAVLKLQQPVINSSSQYHSHIDQISTEHNFAEMPGQRGMSEIKQSTVCVDEEDEDEAVEIPVGREQYTLNTPPALDGKELSIQQNSANGVSQSSAVSLGINDILAAAVMTGQTSLHAADSEGHQVVQASPVNIADSKVSMELRDGITVSLQEVQTSSSAVTSTAVDMMKGGIGQAGPDITTVQVPSNVSCVRLPYDQFLLIPGQGTAQGVGQSDANSIQGSIQQHTILQSPPVHSAAPITPPIPMPQQVPSPQRLGTIPIQIILPSDSQQAMPIVSQLLNTVMNRVEGSGGAIQVIQQSSLDGQTVSNTTNSAESQQSFTVQVPGQGAPLSSMARSNLSGQQSFVMQIPGQANVLGQNTADKGDGHQRYVVQLPGPGNQATASNAAGLAEGQQNFVVQIPGPVNQGTWSSGTTGTNDLAFPVQLIETSGTSCIPMSSGQEIIVSSNQADTLREVSEG